MPSENDLKKYFKIRLGSLFLYANRGYLAYYVN